MPHEIITSVVHKFFPNIRRAIKRTVTIPASQTLMSQHLEGGQLAPGSRPVNYISFNASVGRNSTFHDLANDQIEELCGIEFKALNCLVWIVPCVRLDLLVKVLMPSVSHLLVLHNQPSLLVHRHRTIYVSSTVESIFHPPKCTFQPFANVVRVYTSPGVILVFILPFQVLAVSSCFSIHEFWIFAGRPVHDPLPGSLPYDYRPSLFDRCWKHRICEFSWDLQHIMLSCFSSLYCRSPTFSHTPYILNHGRRISLRFTMCVTNRITFAGCCSLHYKMVAFEVRTSAVWVEGTPDVPSRPSPPMLCVPFPLTPNMVPSLRGPWSYVRICFLP